MVISGSNSRFLSKDVVTEFRGRGQEIRVWPLSFSEFYETVGGDRSQAWKDYYTFGGLPQTLSLDSERTKREYLKDIGFRHRSFHQCSKNKQYVPVCQPD